MKFRALLTTAICLLVVASSVTVNPARAEDNLVPNPSVEIQGPSASLPASWQTGYLWGDLDATYQYPVTGHNSSRAVKVTISRFQSGDAKWYFAPQSVLPNRQYQFSDSYISTVPTYVVAMIERTGGAISYLEIGNMAPAATWTTFAASFVTPVDAQKVSVFHIIAAVGSLTTDNFSLVLNSEPSVAFNRGLVSVTFDDGWQSIHQNALPILEQHSIKSTQYVVTGFLNKPGYMTTSQVKDFHLKGHQVASHTVSHPDLTTLNRRRLTDELSQSKAYLEQTLSTSVLDIAAPYGAYNSSTISFIRRYYRSQRTSDVGYNAKSNFNQYTIRSQYLTPNVTLAEFQSWIETAQNQKVWLVLMYHNVDSSNSAYSVTPQVLSSQMNLLAASGITIKTVDQALSELIPQL